MEKRIEEILNEVKHADSNKGSFSGSLRDIREKYSIESNEYDASLRKFDFEKAIEKSNLDFSDRFSDFYKEQLEGIIDNTNELSEDMMKVQISRMKQLLKTLTNSTAKDKEFLEREYAKSIAFLEEQQKTRFSKLEKTKTFLSESAEKYFDIRSLYSTFMDNNPLAMMGFDLISNKIKSRREKKQQEKELLASDTHRLLMASKYNEDETNKSKFDKVRVDFDDDISVADEIAMKAKTERKFAIEEETRKETILYQDKMYNKLVDIESILETISKTFDSGGSTSSTASIFKKGGKTSGKSGKGKGTKFSRMADKVKSGKLGSLTSKGTNGLKMAGSLLGKVATPLAGGITAYGAYNSGETAGKSIAKGGGAMGGMMAGAATGALIGSAVPIVGTAIGGITGSIAGALLGEEAVDALIGSSKEEKHRNLIIRDLEKRKIIFDSGAIFDDWHVDKTKIPTLNLDELTSLLLMGEFEKDELKLIQKEYDKKLIELNTGSKVTSDLLAKAKKPIKLSSKKKKSILNDLEARGLYDKDYIGDSEFDVKNIDKLNIDELSAILSDDDVSDDVKFKLESELTKRSAIKETNTSKFSKNEAIIKASKPIKLDEDEQDSILENLINSGVYDSNLFGVSTVDKSRIGSLTPKEISAILLDDDLSKSDRKLLTDELIKKQYKEPKSIIKDESQLGSVSQRFESNGNPGAVSSGQGDYGGVSYGAYQFATNTGDADKFVANSKYANEFSGMKAGSQEFTKKWKEIAKQNPEEFKQEQHRYVKEKYYDVQMEKLKESGFDLSNRGSAVQDAIWSTSVQYGANNSKIIRALKGKDLSQLNDSDIISLIQDIKLENVNSDFRSSSSNVRNSVSSRILSEKKLLLAKAMQDSKFKVNSAEPIKVNDKIAGLDEKAKEIEENKVAKNSTVVIPEQSTKRVTSSNAASDSTSISPPVARNTSSSIQRITDRHVSGGMV
jgi:hypothetical protein